MTAKTVVGWVAVGVVVWWVIMNPADAAHLVHNMGAFMSSAAGGVRQFVTRVRS